MRVDEIWKMVSSNARRKWWKRSHDPLVSLATSCPAIDNGRTAVVRLFTSPREHGSRELNWHVPIDADELACTEIRMCVCVRDDAQINKQSWAVSWSHVTLAKGASAPLRPYSVASRWHWPVLLENNGTHTTFVYSTNPHLRWKL